MVGLNAARRTKFEPLCGHAEAKMEQPSIGAIQVLKLGPVNQPVKESAFDTGAALFLHRLPPIQRGLVARSDQPTRTWELRGEAGDFIPEDLCCQQPCVRLLRP